MPKEKQQAIINAGFKVFSKNSYKKSPVSEIADAAGISKSLLFHYFKNKQELYVFLWNEGGRITTNALLAEGCYEKTDLFEAMELGMKAKLKIMKSYPDMTAFVLKAFYENEPSIAAEIQKNYRQLLDAKTNGMIKMLDPNQFIPGIDLNMMYREMYLACEGYLWEAMQKGRIDYRLLEKDFNGMIEFWKKIYCKH